MTAAPVQAYTEGLRPHPKVMISEWADEYRQLSKEASAEAGQWRTSRTPYLREVMDVLSPSHPATDVTFMKGHQIGGTEAGNNAVGAHIHLWPCPMLLVAPKDGLIRDISSQRLTPMIEASEELDAKVYQDNVEDKHFPGGILLLRTARSASGLRSMPIRFVFLDEVDAYPVDVQEEGDPIQLAVNRTSTYGRRKKIFKVSTPTIDGRSRIQSSFERSDQRYYFVPCPMCGCGQVLEFERLKWDEGDPTSVRYLCEACERPFEEYQKTDILEAGDWEPTNPDAPEGVVGFHLSSLYSPVGWLSWSEIAQKFLDAQGNPHKLKVFVNNILGECWEDRGERPEWERLKERAEEYKPGIVPEDALLLTAGVDVQKDRIECEVVGWGPGLESWSVDHVVLEGDVYREAVWQELTALLESRWPHASGGELRIRMAAVDSGFAASEVYSWARTQNANRVMVVKGRSGVDRMIGHRTKAESGVPVWIIGVDEIKGWLYGKLDLTPRYADDGSIDEYPDGYCHYPQYGPEFFKQLTAEKQVIKTDNKGFQKLVWKKERERNEALDLRVYARAAAERLEVDRLDESQWSKLKDRLERSKKRPKKKASKKSKSTSRSESDFWDETGSIW